MALVVGAGLASPVWAQNPTSLGGQPRKLNMKPVSTSKNVAASAAAQQSAGFGISKFMPKLSLPGFSRPSSLGAPTLPQRGLVPSSPPKGPFQPVRPFTP
jgi:hypothetical protein